MLIQGNATIEVGASAFQNADLIVRLEDTSLADAPARLVAETVLHGVSWRGDPAQTLPFTLKIPDDLIPGARYELRLHLDRTRTGEIERGDFITTQSHPLNPAAAMPLRIPLRWLRP